ncbi:hypothetical protein EVAR_68246_1 [Eumeta japonica]|uniref:Uncharacterized protein n=1 Tax=Eumeta variegata TaxID=151549 RepID=A0A4C2A241_EUMVA|nr:hypothetical protein EVAR_68246_1 [Eumeta japonica]
MADNTTELKLPDLEKAFARKSDRARFASKHEDKMRRACPAKSRYDTMRSKLSLEIVLRSRLEWRGQGAANPTTQVVTARSRLRARRELPAQPRPPRTPPLRAARCSRAPFAPPYGMSGNEPSEEREGGRWRGCARAAGRPGHHLSRDLCRVGTDRFRRLASVSRCRCGRSRALPARVSSATAARARERHSDAIRHTTDQAVESRHV